MAGKAKRNGSFIRPNSMGKSVCKYRVNEGEWSEGKFTLNDGEQSLICLNEEEEPALVAGLHEAGVEIILSEDRDEEQEDSRTGDLIRLTLRSNDSHGNIISNIVDMEVADETQLITAVSYLKRASFPPGQLWSCRSQNLGNYAMSRLHCTKLGSVWKSEGTKTEVMIDSLRLCSLNSLHDRSNPESFLLLLRLKIFGCTLALDRVINECSPSMAQEVEYLKTNTLKELIDFVGENIAQGERLDDVAFRDFIEMIQSNLMRPVQLFHDDQASKEQIPAGRGSTSKRLKALQKLYEQRQNSDWVHISLLYELLLKLVGGEVCDLETKKRCITDRFCRYFLQLFESSDSRERDYVKTITHCMYSKLVNNRGTMRQGMASAFLEFIFVSEKHEGIAELLEVYGSIASGFATPIKEEHRGMLINCLLPLHAAKGSEMYQEQLSFVLLQYVQKEPDLVVPIILALLKYWPKRNAPKQILFLGEIGDMITYMDPQNFPLIERKLVNQLCDCISGPHFQVAEYAMGLLNNNYLYSMIFENTQSRYLALPKLLHALRKARHCWNQSVKQISADIIEFLRTLDTELFAQCELACEERESQQHSESPLEQCLRSLNQEELLDDDDDDEHIQTQQVAVAAAPEEDEHESKRIEPEQSNGPEHDGDEVENKEEVGFKNPRRTVISMNNVNCKNIDERDEDTDRSEEKNKEVTLGEKNHNHKESISSTYGLLSSPKRKAGKEKPSDAQPLLMIRKEIPISSMGEEEMQKQIEKRGVSGSLNVQEAEGQGDEESPVSMENNPIQNI